LTIRSQGGKTTGTVAPPTTTPFTSGNIPRVMPTTVWYDLANSSWTGTTDTTWTTAGNWLGPVPSQLAETIIPPSSAWFSPTRVPQLPVAAANANVTKITIQSGGSMSGGTNGQLRITEGFIVEAGA